MTITDTEQHAHQPLATPDDSGATAPEPAADSDIVDSLATGTAEQDDPAPATVDTGGAGGLEILMVDPGTLVVGANTRADAGLDKAFVGSIRDRGVREPIICRRDPGGRLVVRKGQRRTLAAVQAGRDLVPVVVEPEDVDGETARAVDRIIDQLEENQHRAGIGQADEVAAHQQLLDLGLTAGQIARRTHTRTARIKATIAVGSSPLATKMLMKYHLTLEQAAAVADFDDDEDTVAALVEAAQLSEGRFDHVLQRARDTREEARLREKLTRELTAAGARVIDTPDRDPRHRGCRKLAELRPTPRTKPGTALSEAKHAACPGHVAWLENTWRPDERVIAVYGCEDYTAHGHAERYAEPGHTAAPATGGGAVRSGAMSEQERTERREVIANNKAWLSATRVRMQWLRQFLARKNAPKDALTWIAVTLAEGGHDIRRAMEDQHSTARGLLGLTDPEPTAGTGLGDRWYRGCGRPHPIGAAAQTASTGRASVLILAMLLAGLEAGTSKDTWRRPDSDTRNYFTALKTWGYELSDVEQLVLTGGTAEEDRRVDGDPDPVEGRRDEAGGGETGGPVEVGRAGGSEDEPTGPVEDAA